MFINYPRLIKHITAEGNILAIFAGSFDAPEPHPISTWDLDSKRLRKFGVRNLDGGPAECTNLFLTNDFIFMHPNDAGLILIILHLIEASDGLTRLLNNDVMYTGRRRYLSASDLDPRSHESTEVRCCKHQSDILEWEL